MKRPILVTLSLLLAFFSYAGNNGSKTSGNHPTTFKLAIDQPNKTAIGVRALGTSGLAIKHFYKSETAYEGIIGVWPNAFSATLLVEKYEQAFDVPSLNWYYGVGGHMAGKSSWVQQGDWGYRRANGGLGLGVDGIFGIEYKIEEVPIAVSLDVKPFLEVTSAGHAFIALDSGLGIKVTF